MAKPPDGSSSWAHHDDVWVLSDRDRTFASIIAEVSGNRASLVMPCLDAPHDSFFVLGFVRRRDQIEIELHSGAGTETVRWEAHTPSNELIPDRYRSVLPRARMTGPREEAAPIAQLDVSSEGAIEVRDAEGQLRLEIVRTKEGVVEGTDRDASIPVCGGMLRLTIPTHEGASVSKHASSLP